LKAITSVTRFLPRNFLFSFLMPESPVKIRHTARFESLAPRAERAALLKSGAARFTAAGAGVLKNIFIGIACFRKPVAL
jgi:hypothetical protein